MGFIVFYLSGSIKNPSNLYPQIDDYDYEIRHVRLDGREPKIYKFIGEALEALINWESKMGRLSHPAYLTGDVWLGREAEYLKLKFQDDIRRVEKIINAA